MYYDRFDSPVGPLLLAADENALRIIGFPSGKGARVPEPNWVRDRARLAEVRKQLAAYFDGTLTSFDLNLAPAGTPFQRDVWKELCSIPYGSTTSYGALAAAIGRPTAWRAVGAANGANPIPIVIPCHRVIGSDGKLTGFGGGLDTKAALLSHEQRRSGQNRCPA